MEIFKELKTVENSCIGLGFFDGVHKGHKELIKNLVRLSKENDAKSVILSFKQSPAEKFLDKVDYITSIEERELFISQLGVDCMFELNFNDTLMNMTAEDYLNKIIYTYFKPKYILSGFNHTFGKDKTGTPEFLKLMQKKYNYTYIEIPPILQDNTPISSTLIRKMIIDGKPDLANLMLGYNFSIEGIVESGNKIGRTIGFPTANIQYPKYKPELPYGVYCAGVTLNGTTYRGVLNYGIKPTINSGKNLPVAEVHIIGFNDNIYGQKIRISVLNKIRGEKKFSSLEELKNEINKDISKC